MPKSGIEYQLNTSTTNPEKRAAAQVEFENITLGELDLNNVLHFKYLRVMQSGDGDPSVPVNHPFAVAWSRYRDLKRVLTDARLSTGTSRCLIISFTARLRLLRRFLRA